MVRLFHVSDLHFGRVDHAALNWFSGLVATEKPDAVVVTGDLTSGARAREYADAADWLASLAVPVTLEPGNHDLPVYNPVARLISPYRRFLRIERRIERPLAIGGVLLAPLRTTSRIQWRLNWSYGVVRSKNLALTLALLTNKPAGTIALVACHHPLIDRGDFVARGRTIGGYAALQQLAAAGADAVLSGHVHDPFDVKVAAGGREIRLIGAGTLSERTRASAPSFNLLTIDAGVLDATPRVMS